MGFQAGQHIPRENKGLKLNSYFKIPIWLAKELFQNMHKPFSLCTMTFNKKNTDLHDVTIYFYFGPEHNSS